MLISKTPYRISFFGGGSDYPEWYHKFGGKIISTSIDKYIYISFRKLSPFFNHKYKIVWSKIEIENNLKSIKHNVVRKMLPYMNINDPIELHYQADLPAKSGLGSSSSFVVGLFKNMINYKKKDFTKMQIAKESIFFEQTILNECVGIQDQISASFGGFNKIEIDKKGKFIINKIKFGKNKKILNDNLLLVFSGIQRFANNITNKYVKSLTTLREKEMLKIVDQANHAEKLIRLGDFDNFGRLLNEAWVQKRNLSNIISNKKIDDLYDHALNNGALGGKLLGAGGGGFMVFYVPKKLQKKFINKSKKINIVPFKFTNFGSKIILDN